MDHYYILRNNQESGPFSLKEIKATGLFASDLVWQDGESNCWKYPAEFDALKSFIKAPEPKPPMPAKAKAVLPQENVYYAPAPAVATRAPVYAAAEHDWKLEEAEILSPPSFEALQKKQAKRNRRRAWKQPVNFAANHFGLAVMVLGVMLAAVMVKKAVDSIDFTQPEETAEAHAIETGNTHRSDASHTALSTPMQVAAVATPAVALTEKPVTEAPKILPEKQALHSAKPDPDTALNNPQNATTGDSSEGEKPVTEKGESKTVALPQNNTGGKPDDEEKAGKNAAESLQVSANEYSVGLFGGVSNLELTINNLSSQPIDKASVEVDYLKPNGKVVQTQTVDVGGIAAGATRKIAVPNSSRGVKVRYRVLGL